MKISATAVYAVQHMQKSISVYQSDVAVGVETRFYTAGTKSRNQHCLTQTGESDA